MSLENSHLRGDDTEISPHPHPPIHVYTNGVLFVKVWGWLFGLVGFGLVVWVGCLGWLLVDFGLKNRPVPPIYVQILLPE